jgi:hypothetical protein
MMQRLRELSSSPDSATARAAALLSAMRPLDADRLQRRPLPAADVGLRSAARRVRTGLVLAITLGSVVAAAATLRRGGWIGERALGLPSQPAAPSVVARSPSADRGLGAVAEAPAGVPVTESPSTLPAAGDGVEVGTVRGAAALARPHSAPPWPSHAAWRESVIKEPSRAIGAVDDESALIVSAVRALRRDGDPIGAQALAEEALRRYPHGVQVEEAMALVMEAASARGDLPGARRAAQKYQESYRAGRFADRAQRILATLPR